MRVTTAVPHADRAGATLVELVVALVVAAVLSGAALRVLDRAQRFVHGTALVAESRAQLAAAHVTMRGAIEEVSSGEGDLGVASDTALAWNGAIAHAVACAVGPQSVDLAPPDLVLPIPLVWWSDTPQPGDRVVVLDEGGRPGALDDAWWESALVSVQRLPNACSGTPYVDPVADAGKGGWRFVVADSVSPTVRPGATLRVLRRQRLALYRSGGQWMLGWADSTGVSGGWNGIQPLAGPLAPPAPNGGLVATWMDSTRGAFVSPLVATSGVASARIAIRAQTSAPLRMDGRVRGIHLDSVELLLPLRNRR